MHLRLDYILTVLLLFTFVSFLHAGENDYVTIDEPNFENVDVVVETAWGTSEKTEGVDVLVLFNNDEKPIGMVLAKKKRKLSEIMLVEGVTVKLIDHDTQQVLKTVKVKS